jgi:cytochrome c553
MAVVHDIVQGKTTPCVTCHGLDLMGVADVPPIAGRSPKPRPAMPPQFRARSQDAQIVMGQSRRCTTNELARCLASWTSASASVATDAETTVH